MRRPAGAFLVLLAFLPGCGGKGVPGPPPSGPLGIALRLKPSRVELGKPSLLTLVLRRDPGVEAETPSPEAVFGKQGKVKVLEKERRTFRLPGGAEVEERTYSLFPFRTGRLSLPALTVKGRYRGKEITASAGPLELQVKSVLPARDKGVEEPGKSLQVPSSFPWTWVAAAALGLLLVLFLVRGLARRKRKAGVELPP
ncbi:MAG TPA: hypothetical protein ENJ97_02330, partial [Planctomycetes bacterium]|nr:hypothetical protein [Planctomycetota bacterium]